MAGCTVPRARTLPRSHLHMLSTIHRSEKFFGFGGRRHILSARGGSASVRPGGEGLGASGRRGGHTCTRRCSGGSIAAGSTTAPARYANRPRGTRQVVSAQGGADARARERRGGAHLAQGALRVYRRVEHALDALDGHLRRTARRPMCQRAASRPNLSSASRATTSKQSPSPFTRSSASPSARPRPSGLGTRPPCPSPPASRPRDRPRSQARKHGRAARGAETTTQRRPKYDEAFVVWARRPASSCGLGAAAAARPSPLPPPTPLPLGPPQSTDLIIRLCVERLINHAVRAFAHALDEGVPPVDLLGRVELLAEQRVAHGGRRPSAANVSNDSSKDDAREPPARARDTATWERCERRASSRPNFCLNDGAA